jgi:hypothetical protein
MTEKKFPKSGLPIRKTVDFLPQVFQTQPNKKFFAASFDPWIQPGTLEKTVGYVGRRYGKTFNGEDVYLDDDNTLRSRYQLEPSVVYKKNEKTENFYDFFDLKNIVNFFGNEQERDDKIFRQKHYSLNPPIDWDKFINYREYYWVPSGPTPIRVLGQSQKILSTYRVRLGTADSYVFAPDGLTNNPTLTLYKGQTYKFVINSPGESFVIRRNYDTGSLFYNPNKSYSRNQLVIYDNKLWQAQRDISVGDDSTISELSENWKLFESSISSGALDYNKGVDNNSTESGTLTFEVPFDAPDVLYYQSTTNPDRFGRFLIEDIESNTPIDVEKEILGKTNYTSSNGISLSNGMVINFGGAVSPSSYSTGNWLIEGVGKSISLTLFTDLVVPVLSSETPDVLFDDGGFDSEPFDDASAYPGTKDYITIAKSSQDRNPWSRYNRWFHRSVLELASQLSGTSFEASESFRAKRPIIEFSPNLQLFNHGSIAKQTVDFVDKFTTDVFSVIEGSQGYSVDGEPLFDGARLLIVADTDSLANNKIYRVDFINHNGSNQITLVNVSDTESVEGETVLIRRGRENQGKMYWFDGSNWQQSQEKTKVNQSPLFDVFDEDGISFANTERYPVSSFRGTELLSYKIGSGPIDSELGFSISYLNINNVGDIQFEYDWDTQQFVYADGLTEISKQINTGYYYFFDNQTYDNSWIETENRYLQPIIESVKITDTTNTVQLNTVDWPDFENDTTSEIYFYVNGVKTNLTYTRLENNFIFNQTFNANDIITVKLLTSVIPHRGYYEFPIGLEKNPLNNDISTFTLGQASDHVQSGLEFLSDFIGIAPGLSNLRDLAGYQNRNKRFLKHESPAPIALTTLVDKQASLIKSLRYAKKGYNDFKNTFIQLASDLYTDQSPTDFVDTIIEEYSKSKNTNSPFFKSDMIGFGAYTKINYEVEDEGIITYALTEKFSLDDESNRAVYVYINGVQLLHNADYEFNQLLGFITVLTPLAIGDLVEIREYVSSSSCFIPPTPTKLGLYKKYTPMIYLDDTYRTPRLMIQGHDGSRSSAFGDYRDDVILELEKRIYNNIKQGYNPDLFDLDQYQGGYYGNSEWGRDELAPLTSREFLSWLSDTTLDYVKNVYFDSEDSFTYTYSKMSDPSRLQSLPGWWRGIYRWFYDTDRPHTHPWEILGFSEKPIWWESEYGPAPYTSGNLILWEDIRDGIIRQGNRAGTYPRYARTSIINHIPVDKDGNLLSPLDSNLAKDFSLVQNQNDFKVGDVSPVENAWYLSSEYPFAVLMSACLLNPFEVVAYAMSKGNFRKNKIGQLVSLATNRFLKSSDIATNTKLNLFYIVQEFLASQGISRDTLVQLINNIEVLLSYRMSGFVDQQQQKFLLDSKTPTSTSSSIFIPQENFDIVFNTSVPIATATYSGVVVEKVNTGFKVIGYDKINATFKYFEAISSQADRLISVGGVSEDFVIWTENTFYGNGIIAEFNNKFYRSLKSHTSGDTFDTTLWRQLSKIPNVGAVEAFRKTNFKPKVKTLPYGTIFSDVQAVVDFLLGYSKYLESIGFEFSQYDSEIKESKDWLTSCKEFMYWTQHNWAEGSLIALSPSAQQIKFNYTIGVPDNLLDSFYDYEVLKSDGVPLAINFINVDREFQSFTIETVNTTEGIYFVKLYQILKEHVAIFDQRTLFNDIIYEPTSGYRQERIKSRGFRTVDWDGKFITPGFIYDDAKTANWTSFVDYRLGDIIFYKGVYYSSKGNHTSGEDFDITKWNVLDSVISKKLIPNFDYKINQFEDYYNLDSEGLATSQKSLGRHATGFQKRAYLDNLSEDDTTQFKLYQGFIRDKGTKNAAVKIFDKLSKVDDDALVLHEQWAIRTGLLGGVQQLNEVEFEVRKDQFKLNPQPVLVLDSFPSSKPGDRYLRIQRSDISTVDQLTSTNIIETAYQKVRTAGYVNLNDVDVIVGNDDEILNIDISTIRDNDTIYVPFYNNDWEVFQITTTPLLYITDVIKDQNTVILEFNRLHYFSVGDFVGINNIPNLNGFYRVAQKSSTSIAFQVDSESKDPEFDISSITRILSVKSARIDTIESLSQDQINLLKQGSKLWIDSDENGRWLVIEKNKVYTDLEIIDYGVASPNKTGQSIVYAEQLRQTISGMPGRNLVAVFLESNSGLAIKQLLSPDTSIESRMNGSFGNVVALSPDNTLLAIGAPLASGIISNYIGIFNPLAAYEQGDIVLNRGRLWRATEDVNGDGSTIDVNQQDWELADIIRSDFDNGRGAGNFNQGCVFIYQWNGQTWNTTDILLSSRPDDNEQFGSSLALSKNGSDYWLAVGAPGAEFERGRVYLYKYSNGEWSGYVDTNYVGVYDGDSTVYTEGSIVWYEGDLYKFLGTSTLGDGSTLTNDSMDWIKIDPISTSSSLPTNVALEDDGSSLASGLLNPNDVAELTKEGEQFGHAIAFNSTGSILVVGVPEGDDQYFPRYRGVWRRDYEYIEGDVVKHEGMYHQLIDNREDASTVDSTIKSFNEKPDEGLPWMNVGDSTDRISGKLFVYKRDEYGIYKLHQTITGKSLPEINDTGDGSSISTRLGDGLGYSVDIDSLGNNIVAGSPYAQTDNQDQGVVYLLNSISLDDPEWRLTQKLEIFEEFTNSMFGSAVSISPNANRIVVGAKDADYRIPTYFEEGISFDGGATSFTEVLGDTGQVYVFERTNGRYILAEKLEPKLKDNESFGHSIDVSGSIIVVGSPTYFHSSSVGMVRLFKKDPSVNSFTVLNREAQLVDIKKIKNVYILDESTGIRTEVEPIDPIKGKISGLADQEIKFKTIYDPATYTIGTDEQIVDPDTAWFEKNVGKLWWDLSTTKWYHCEQGSTEYRIGNWLSLAEGSTVDVYEWVESKLLPSQWGEIADTAEGLNQGISGQPLYSDDTVYSKKILYNPSTDRETETLYYYWVKGSTIIPTSSNDRVISAANVQTLISNPASAGSPMISFIDADKFLLFNAYPTISSDRARINIELFKDDIDITNPVYKQYQLLSEGLANDVPSDMIEEKWIDSLIGFNSIGQAVPDSNLPENKKYGVSFRPRQSMFVDRLTALKLMIERVNQILEEEPFADILDFTNLNAVDAPPEEVLNEYDQTVDSIIELSEIANVLAGFFPNRVRSAELNANIVNGEIDTIDIIDPGFGYKTTPYIEIVGSGKGATAEITLDNQGRVASARVITRGKRYDSAIVKIRQFSTLVLNDQTIDGFWSLYSWDQLRRQFYRTRTQAYDVRKYWSYVDWWKFGYTEESRIIREVNTFFELSLFSTAIGDLIRIKEYGNGGWAVLEKTEYGTGDIDNTYNLVGRQNGTIKLLDTLYDDTKTSFGFDQLDLYDSGNYDSTPTNELRFIIKAIKENILIGEYKVVWNELFFNSLRYILTENQNAVDWFFKTSFIKARHNVGVLEQKVNYKNDNLPAFEEYLNEIKPYRTTIKEFISSYARIEDINSDIIDFDLPPAYNQATGILEPVLRSSNLFSVYPWKFWKDNNGFGITEILVSFAGTGYTYPPKVIIEGDGTGAIATAFITNGRVSGITVVNQGSGYTASPTVSLVGGNGTGNQDATAVAVLGNSKIRSFLIDLKFDRISQTGIYESFTNYETFIANGSSSVFNLSYPPNIDKSMITVNIDNQIILDSEYTITLFYQETTVSKNLKGKISFLTVPAAGSTISITYEKNDRILDAVNRIRKYYAPSSGMIGNDISQLMTGIDFGGVEIQGTTFDVTGGWDALPWFTDGWDSVESNSDFYLVLDGSTAEITLPYAPEDGQLISVYIKRSGSDRTIRIDDPYYDAYDGSTPQPNGRIVPLQDSLMPSILGDGSTTTFDISDYPLNTSAGDVLIFRQFDSDGSVVINDVNLLDTKISGGTFSAINQIYTTATGTSAEEIIIEGGKFVSPEKVPAPEENLPGQILDSLSIKVFQVNETGAPLINNKIVISDGSTLRYPVSIDIILETNVLVYIDKIKKEYAADDTKDYFIDFVSNEIVLSSAAPIDSYIEIVVLSAGGLGLLDFSEYVADGTRIFFETDADFDSTTNILVSVNGVEIDAGYISGETANIDYGLTFSPNSTIIQFAAPPSQGQSIKIYCLGSTADTDSSQKPFIRFNTQEFTYDGTIRSFTMDGFVELSRGSPLSSIIVEVNGTKLEGPDTYYEVYDGTNNIIEVGSDPDTTVTSVDVQVYINNIIQPFVSAYVYDGTTKTVIVNTEFLTLQDVIKIELTNTSRYTVDNDVLTISSDVNLNVNDKINITWFSEYPTLDTVSDIFVGGKVNYQLKRSPISSDYVWAYLNGAKLTKDLEYRIEVPRNVLYLNIETTSTDRIEVLEFGNQVFKIPRAFEIYKDMLNISQYKRFSIDAVELAIDLNYYDQEITVTDASGLDTPVPERNIPGMVIIGKEKIQYMSKTGNVLGQLRRGVFGSPVENYLPSGTKVVNSGSTDTIPYNDTQDRFDFISDGSSLLIGPLEFIPIKSSRTDWESQSIPDEYGPCDTVEVFVGGLRLRKNQIAVYNENSGGYSPDADIVLDPEFSVDGNTPYMRLTASVPAGVRIQIIRKTGRLWYERALNTASKGITLLENNTPVAKFIDKKSTQLP